MERTIFMNQTGGAVLLLTTASLLIVTATFFIGSCDTKAEKKPHLTYIPLLLRDSISPQDSAQLRQDSIMRSLREKNPKWKNREQLRSGMTIGEVEKLMGSEWELRRRQRASKFYAGQCYEEECRWRLDSLADIEITFFTCDGKDSSDRVLLSEPRIVPR